MTIYQRIQDLAKARKISIRQVEHDLNFSNGTIRKWDSSAPTQRLTEVANYFSVTVDYLLGQNSTPEWANHKDTLDLKKFLDDNDGSFTYGGDDLTDDEKEKLKIAMTQIFWDRHKHD